MRISSEHVKRNVFLSIFKWGFNPTADPNSQARGQRSEPHHPAPRVGLSLGGGGGGQGGGGLLPLPKTPPYAEQHRLVREFYRRHKYYIAHSLSSASPGSRCSLYSNTIIRWIPPDLAIKKMPDPLLGMTRVTGVGVREHLGHVVGCGLRVLDFILIPVFIRSR